MDVGCSLWGFNASTMTLQHHSDTPTPLNFPKIHTHLQRCISIRVYPHAHPQHIKVLKHCVYMLWMWDAVCKALEPQP